MADIKDIDPEYPVRIEYLNEATSTNDLASAKNKRHGDVIWVENQTKGRGQRGNSWNSVTGENLTFSLVIEPENLPAERQFYISKIVSISIVEILANFGLTAEIKWPNDIYINDRKIAGILIENDMQGANIAKSILGIGLNVNQDAFDPSLPNPTSMRLETGKSFDRKIILEEILNRILGWNQRLTEGLGSEIDDVYSCHLYRKEGTFLFQEPTGGAFEASIVKVEPSGELILRRSDGISKGYFFKEVEFVIKK